jgi:hypothetical protein
MIGSKDRLTGRKMITVKAALFIQTKKELEILTVSDSKSQFYLLLIRPLFIIYRFFFLQQVSTVRSRRDRMYILW